MLASYKLWTSSFVQGVSCLYPKTDKIFFFMSNSSFNTCLSLRLSAVADKPNPKMTVIIVVKAIV